MPRKLPAGTQVLHDAWGTSKRSWNSNARPYEGAWRSPSYTSSEQKFTEGIRWEDFTQCHRTWGNQTWKEDSYKRLKPWFLVLATGNMLWNQHLWHFRQIFVDLSYGCTPNQPINSFNRFSIETYGDPPFSTEPQSIQSLVGHWPRSRKSNMELDTMSVRKSLGVVQTWPQNLVLYDIVYWWPYFS